MLTDTLRRLRLFPKHSAAPQLAGGLNQLAHVRPLFWLQQKRATRRLRRQQNLSILAPYRRPGFFERHRWLSLAMLLFCAVFYGLWMGAVAPLLTVQMMLPVAVLVVIVVWVLPDDSAPLERTTLFLFTSYMIGLMVWPDYLAIQLPGLPWITFARLFALPMCLVYLMSLSQSRPYRQEIGAVLKSSGPTWKLLVAFSALALVSIGFSSAPMFSANKYIVFLYSCVGVFVVACHLFLRLGKARWMAVAFWVGATVACIVGILEARAEQVLWAGHIPSILKIEDPIIQTILSAKVRAATGIYRVKGKFTTPLGLSEFLALCSPFILHTAVMTRRISVKLFGAGLLVAMTWVIIRTDARLGFIGLLITFIVYSFYLAFRRWQADRSSLLAPLIVLAYPAFVLTFFAASFFVRRIHNMVWGHGAYSASTEGRVEQIQLGIPMILKQPWGHGIGRAAETLGFTNQLGTLTIDTYYLSIALEVGVVGFVLYYGIFLCAIWRGAQAIRLPNEDRETDLLAPAVIMLVNFVIIKSVFSQQENHPLFFAGLGMAVALSYRRMRAVTADAALPESLSPAALAATGGRAAGVTPGSVRSPIPAVPATA